MGHEPVDGGEFTAQPKFRLRGVLIGGGGEQVGHETAPSRVGSTTGVSGRPVRCQAMTFSAGAHVCALRGVGQERAVRGELDARVGAQRVVGGRGFDREHIECGPGEMPAVQCPQEGVGVDEFTARDVHEERARPHPGEQGLVHEAVGLRGERGVQGQHVGAADQLVEAEPVDLGRPAGRVGVRVEGGHAAEDGRRHPRHGARDTAEPDEAERQLACPARQSAELRVPAAAAHRGVGVRQVAYEGEGGGERVHGDVLGGRVRQVAHPQAAPAGLGGVHHVVACGHRGQHAHGGQPVQEGRVHGA